MLCATSTYHMLSYICLCVCVAIGKFGSAYTCMVWDAHVTSRAAVCSLRCTRPRLQWWRTMHRLSIIKDSVCYKYSFPLLCLSLSMLSAGSMRRPFWHLRPLLCFEEGGSVCSDTPQSGARKSLEPNGITVWAREEEGYFWRHGPNNLHSYITPPLTNKLSRMHVNFC